MKRICVYGKGGIGKSTAVSNLAAAMAQAGKRVAVVGCDPKADSTRGLMGRRIPTVLDQLKTGASGEIAFTDSRGVRCIEAGGPEPGTGCAGRGIIVAMEEIRSRGLLDDRDVVLYDVLGDVVCGGFSMPLREQVADEVYLVTTSDFMALYAANNICRGIRKYAQSGRIRLAGIIHNGRSSVDNDSLLRAFAAELGTTVAGKIPMSPLIGQAELERRTVVDCAPESGPAQAFRALASVLLDNRSGCIPEPMTDDGLEALCRKAARGIASGERRSLRLRAGELEPWLGPVKFKPEVNFSTDSVGLVHGLAWTSVGGEVLDVECSVVPGSGKLELTGNLGDVMKESCQAAVTYIRSRTSELGIDPDFHKNTDIHLHFPEGAVPKDGPSAGAAICLCVVSALTNRPVRADIAMTGEITLRGRVLPIGGIQEKTMAALRAGIHEVLLPEDNVSDLAEMDPNVRNAVNFTAVSHMDQVLKKALRPAGEKVAE